MIQRVKSIIKDTVFKLLMFLFRSKKTSVKSSRIGICTLLCHRDINLFIYNLMSFFYQIKKNLPVYVVDDGTLTPKDIRKLHKYFTVIYESSPSSEKKMAKILKGYTNIYTFRFDRDACILRKKLDAIFLNPYSRFIYLDADLLCYNYPQEIVRWLDSDSKTVLYTGHLPYPKDFYNNPRALMEHCCRLLFNERFSCPIDPTFNSGFLCIPGKDAIGYQRLDEVLKFFYKTYFAYIVVAEETALYLSFDYQHAKKLPLVKYVSIWDLQEYLKCFSEKITILHYSGAAKYFKFRLDAVKLALKNNLFRQTVHTSL